MSRYRITFSGRRIGAIGIFQTFVREIEAASPEAARLKLYDEFEHISLRRIVQIDDDEPMSLTREVVRQRKKDLRVCGQGVAELDLWLAAGLIKQLDITYIGLEVYGTSAALRRAVESGHVETCVEWSSGAISWRMKAAAMGVPFIPVRAMLGSDTFNYSAAKVVNDPFTGLPVCLLPALILDVRLIHVHRADRYGNGQIEGISGFAAELARASKTLIISTEEIVDEETIRSQPDRTIIPYYLVDAVVPEAA